MKKLLSMQVLFIDFICRPIFVFLRLKNEREQKLDFLTHGFVSFFLGTLLLFFFILGTLLLVFINIGTHFSFFTLGTLFFIFFFILGTLV